MRTFDASPLVVNQCEIEQTGCVAIDYAESGLVPVFTRKARRGGIKFV
jgi:hypothetical protein